MNKSIVLLSGGQDSTTVLHYALAEGAKHGRKAADMIALSVFYGQRHERELYAAADIARAAGVRHMFIEVDSVFRASTSALLSRAHALASDGGLPDKEMPNGLPTSFVPGRNLLFFAAAASFAGSVGADRIYTGVCQTDYSGYPDCRAEFVTAMNAAIKMAWPSGVDYPMVIAPLMHMTKAETVLLAQKLGPECMKALARSVTCYEGETPGCGRCAACDLRAKGFAEAGIADPSIPVYDAVTLTKE